MLHFFKSYQSDLSKIRVDIHNHILPNIDDGSSNITESIILSSQLSQWGISEIIYTPHIFSDLYPNTTFSITNAYNSLVENNIHSKMYSKQSFAAEYMLDESLRKLLKTGESLLCLKNNLLLVEFPLHFKNHDTETILYDLFIAGYQPVIAHPERYTYLHHSIENYKRLKDIGCYFQLNLLSMGAYYGKEFKTQAEKLLKLGLIDFISTDVHHVGQLDSLQRTLTSKLWHKWENYPFMNSLFID